MPRIKKYTILENVPDFFQTETKINPARIFSLNNKSVKDGCIIYLCEREIRAKDNFALQFSIKKSHELKLLLKIIHPKISYEYAKKQNFIDSQIAQAKKQFIQIGLNFEIVNKSPSEILNEMKVAMLIVDFNPILKRDYLQNIDCKIYEIDGHNIVPSRFVSDKQEYGASTLRRKIYYNISDFLTEFDNLIVENVEADSILDNFIKNKLPNYAEFRNDVSKDILSGLSKYLNLGFISSQRVAMEIIKSDVSDINKEVFLEELVVRKELADNFCFYAEDYRNLSSIPNWAKLSLNSHKSDLRVHTYSLKDLQNAVTKDRLWNSSQIQLKKEGTVFGYFRMYWAKKILEWAKSPEEALEIAIYLNDKYAYDSPSANGYVGILWSIGGLHDRAFIDYPVTGKIRRMTYDSIKRKYKLSEYIQKYSQD